MRFKTLFTIKWNHQNMCGLRTENPDGKLFKLLV